MGPPRRAGQPKPWTQIRSMSRACRATPSCNTRAPSLITGRISRSVIVARSNDWRRMPSCSAMRRISASTSGSGTATRLPGA
ncbi:Uncharacterised protein [Bordetella pertussis]|nr:Uncharacterised protein [Bordetella pertussis]